MFWFSAYTVLYPFLFDFTKSLFGRVCFRTDTYLNHSPSCDVDSVEDDMPFFLLKAFIFPLLFLYGGGVGLLYEAGLMVVYIHVFVPQNHLDYIHFTFKTCIF